MKTGKWFIGFRAPGGFRLFALHPRRWRLVYIPSLPVRRDVSRLWIGPFEYERTDSRRARP